MERQKYIVLALLLFFSTSTLWATNKTEIYKAYISNDMNAWKKVIDKMDQQKTKSKEFKMELLNYQYGYIGYCLGQKDKKQAEKYIELGDEIISNFVKQSYKPSLVNAYKSAFYGFKIGLNILKAPFIGPKSVDCAVLAMKQDTDNPYGYIQFANSQYYMPAAFGGSKTEALKNYLKAEKLMAANKEQMKEDWNYLSLLAMIGQAHTELKDYQSAKAYYQKALTIEPNFLWVKNELYPALLKKLN